ncbi:hypothetical protein Kpho02_06420 [Kitasatospora phosalacinea]|uniref:WGR domain-containing protein n=1 Tax=Kitasatospora phosalacinea TaxID=2065 RepID=A0A9W6UZK7_9ACTN|nr:DUF4132 domain-containing protein [Kitasatospora phosalacinea]GLW68343.1 hypothetical protein Kpho02_06420 [Kitasatospora phosalacinea]
MRRWELVGDGSAKFWEAAVEGPVVRVRYGRIGTEGREQSKELASADAASAHFARQVAEKERKGYAEVAAGEARQVRAEVAAGAAGGVAEAEAAGVRELPDEEAFVLPDAWRRLVLPRRGGRVPKVSPPGPEALEREQRRIAARGDWVEQVLDAPASDPELVRAARAYLAGAPDPVGAAAVADMLPTPWRADAAEQSLFADVWTARHGLSFAVRAVLETHAVETHYLQSGRDVSDIALRPRTAHQSHHARQLLPVGERLRTLLAAAPEAEYREVLAVLTGHRGTPRQRALASFLAPGVPGWMDECLADMPHYADGDQAELQQQLLCSLDDPAQAEAFVRNPWVAWRGWTAQMIATVADSVGVAAAPLVGEGFGRTYGTDEEQRIAGALARFPSDGAFRLLLTKLDSKHVRPALQEAAQRYPVRAVRLLAEAAARGGRDGVTARSLLDSHVRLHRELLPQILPRLDGATAALVAELDGARPQAAEAAPEALPPLLVSPPWTRPRTRRKARVLEGLRPDEGVELVWRPGEQERWGRSEFLTGWQFPADTDWAAQARTVLGESHSLWYPSRLLVQGPVEALAPALAAWRPADLWGGSEYLPPVVARYGAAALPMVLHAARAKPAALSSLLLPFRAVGAARLLADGLVRLKSVHATARSWFARHGVAGALLLVPDAVGPAGRERGAAEQALRLVAADAGEGALLAAVEDRYGAAAAEVVAEALATDPMENALPARVPVLPAWAQPAVLPQLLLRAPGEEPSALPAEAVRHVLTMLAMSKPGVPYPGLAVVAETCRAEGLAEFGWALFEQWQQVGMPSKESWVLSALGVLGDDTTVRRLTPVVREWPGQGAHQRAVEGLDVLAAIGTDLALLHLHGVAQRVKFKALKARAQEKIAEVAEGLGLTPEQLADRLVPDLGLGPDGTTVIDYGSRTFTVGFDEQLRPYVLDADGKRRKDLPAPGVKDDPELAPAERKRFMALKKDVRTVAGDQLRRLEGAMVAQRSWSAEEFTSLFVEHPLVWHLARRLVWLADDAAFRVAEDRTFTDVHDEVFALPADATVRIAHPLHLGEERVEQWSELFADYEILQPFPQLGRPVRRFTPEEAAANRLHRFEGCTVPVGRLLGLTKRGWERGEPQDAGVERWFSKRLGEGCHLVIQLDEGIAVGLVDMFPDQTFEAVWLDSAPGDHWSSRDYPLRYGDLDPVAASELLADLEEVTAG